MLKIKANFANGDFCFDDFCSDNFCFDNFCVKDNFYSSIRSIELFKESTIPMVNALSKQHAYQC